MAFAACVLGWRHRRIAMPIPGDVKKAIELLRAHPERSLSIATLAAACGVAPRTLQKHFLQFVGKTPVELRFELRMGRARRELLRAKPKASVTAIATSCGINHLGRFALLYRKRFGETPSQTLSRRRVTGNPPAELMIISSRLDRPVIALHSFACPVPSPALAELDVSREIGVCLARERWFVVGSPERARYHLQGSVRCEGGSIRVTALLSSGESGRLLWADRWQGAVEGIFDLEDRIVARVTTAVRRSLFKAEIERAAGGDPTEANGWELSMMAMQKAMRIDATTLSHALELSERAMELSPSDGLPVALAAWCRAQRGSHHLAAQHTAEKKSALLLVGKGAALTNDDPVVEALFGGACAVAGDFEQAASHINRSLALDGGSAWGWNRLGMLDIYRGNFIEATESFQIARGLDPYHPLNFMCSIGLGSANFDAGRYEEGARWFASAIAEHPAAIWINRFRAPALLRAGRSDEARHSFTQLIARHPDLTLTAIQQAIPYTRSHWSLLAEGLADLGMPL
jgi:AraC-like DNA-binding protein/tetratricopeptide (TPR) repeat protein